MTPSLLPPMHSLNEYVGHYVCMEYLRGDPRGPNAGTSPSASTSQASSPHTLSSLILRLPLLEVPTASWVSSPPTMTHLSSQSFTLPTTKPSSNFKLTESYLPSPCGRETSKNCFVARLNGWLSPRGVRFTKRHCL